MVAIVGSLSLAGKTPSMTGASGETGPAAAGLGLRLGTVSLFASGNDVLRILGEPQLRTITHGMGSPQWEYSSGLVVRLRFHTAVYDPDQVWTLIARPPFAGSTAEGFRLGNTREAFRRIYSAFEIRQSDPNQLQIKDEHGTLLNVIFDSDGSATSLFLADSKCPDCAATPPGTPGPKEKSP
jgi:hypothetical protein